MRVIGLSTGSTSCSIGSGNASEFNLWLRYRVVFQGLTVLAALGGSLYYNHQRDLDRAAMEEERIRKREIRMREQEQKPVNQSIPEGGAIGSDARRALMLKKVAEQAHSEGRLLRMPNNSSSTTNNEKS
ncbi:uncharacterized protein MELLADRAFT_111235 [Melampsora larici-populina 98AG31]|uniref:HIG1 domain-containing protein n=1 Tax=Melampsora larici-populina (strain 98AG31 / pathotype 3-4-7) TaxID=747676 RepID=F4S2H2_MELLP|nr:uncharacterized protein MELLADRAFT_111235 [Melampsora larici-populina 98AG31]EGG01206.1 hypothetical protein MELLADRAFT_111235 [Melampsora larici-populina 98AG31]